MYITISNAPVDQIGLICSDKSENELTKWLPRYPSCAIMAKELESGGEYDIHMLFSDCKMYIPQDFNYKVNPSDVFLTNWLANELCSMTNNYKQVGSALKTTVIDRPVMICTSSRQALKKARSLIKKATHKAIYETFEASTSSPEKISEALEHGPSFFDEYKILHSNRGHFDRFKCNRPTDDDDDGNDDDDDDEKIEMEEVVMSDKLKESTFHPSQVWPCIVLQGDEQPPHQKKPRLHH